MLRYQQMPLSAHTSDDRVLDSARSWLDYCQANHTSCAQRDAEPTMYPSRLVDLCPPGAADGNTWRLVEDTSNLAGGYATLSHRWGRGDLEPFKLTRGTRDSMVQGLSDTCLSGTYRDAIRVVRRLSLRYIWIDSLCVQQDPGTLDIQVAAYRMAEVYGHSSCNIATLTAQQHTMFSSRDPHLFSPSATTLPASVYGLHFSYTILLAKQWERSISETPLCRRAWILQEQLLPRRMLYFGADQMLWSCSEGAFCEQYPLDDMTCAWLEEGMFEGDIHTLRTGLGQAVRASQKSAMSSQPQDDSDTEDLSLEIDWIDLLMLYGHRDLTFAADKLLAIAGISQLLASIEKRTIVSGMLSQEFPLNLLWVMDHNTARLRGYNAVCKSPVHRAPSWSWAYYDGPITLWLDVDRQSPIARVNHIKTESTTIDTSQVVHGGEMRLLAASLPLVSRLTSTSPHKSWSMPFPSTFQQSPSTHQAPLTELVLTEGELADDGRVDQARCEGSHGTIFFDLTTYPALVEPLTAVFIARVTLPPRRSRPEQAYRFEGLVLRHHPMHHQTETGQTVYERAGVFAVTCETGSDPGLDVPMLQAWHLDRFMFRDGMDAPVATGHDIDHMSFMTEFIID